MSQDNSPLPATEYQSWLNANADKQGTDEYKTVQRAYDAAKILEERQELKKIWNDPQTTPAFRASIMGAYAINKAQEFALSALTRGGMSAAGQIAGRRVGGPVGERLGAAAGAVLGGITDSALQGQPINPVELAGEATAAAVNPRSVMGSAATAAAVNAATQAIQTGKVDPSAVSAAGGTAASGALMSKVAAPGVGKPVVDPMQQARYDIFKELRKYGVKANPAELERGSQVINTIAGVQQLSVDASKANQRAWQIMAREATELPTQGRLYFKPTRFVEGKGYIRGDIDEQIHKVSEPYRQLSALSKEAADELEAIQSGAPVRSKFWAKNPPKDVAEAVLSAKSNVEELKRVRFETKKAFDEQNKGIPGAREKIELLKEQEAMLEVQLEKAAAASGKPKLLDELKQARPKIARLKSLDMATTSYGFVDPAMLSKLREAGVPLEGNLEKIALFHDAIRGSAQEAVGLGATAIPNINTSYTGRNIAQGNRAGLFSGGMPVVSAAIRDFILNTEPVQNRFARPKPDVAPQSLTQAFASKATLLPASTITPDEAIAAMELASKSVAPRSIITMGR